jgi:tRNA A-37 threonylcarbamoyl transferase component Bud32
LTDVCPNCGRLNRPGARYCASCQAPLSTSAALLQPGQMLGGGSYRVVQPLGKGGMGAVWLVAQTRAFDRLAVLKEVVEYYDPTDPTEREKALLRFEAEARTLGDLKHPGIPDLYAFFSEGGHNYLVMEYIEGPDLRQGLTGEDRQTGQLVAGGPLPAEEVLRYTIQVCEVLEYLGTRQPPVIHNDIKPGNIIVDRNSGRAVLVDFGTAHTRYLRVVGQPDGSRVSLYGTVGYAAPELFHGTSEPRSDVYSLGATAYHLLTDDDPRDHPMQYPQLDRLPPALAAILRAALAHTPDERPAAAELRQELERYLAGQTGPLRALAFPDGDAADERQELLALALKHWSYAAGILHDGTLANWLRGTLYDPVAAQAAEAAVNRWPNNPDAALEDFIRQLNPAALPPGKMELRTGTLRLPEAARNQRIVRTIEIVNRGQGPLRGEIFATEAWIRIANSAFACPPGRTCQLAMEIDTAGLEPGRAHQAGVTLIPAGGMPEVVAVEVRVAARGTAPLHTGQATPALAVDPGRIDLGRVSSGSLTTKQVKVTVTNAGGASAQVRVQGEPPWLLVKPQTFRLAAGARQVVRVRGRVDKARSGQHQEKLTFAVDGGHQVDVDVVLEVKKRGLF